MSRKKTIDCILKKISEIVFTKAALCCEIAVPCINTALCYSKQNALPELMKKTAVQTETDWLRRLQQNDEQALTAIMQHYFADLYNYGSRFTVDDGLIRDCIQEVFISLWQRRENVTAILSPKYYLLRAVKNKVLKSLHKIKTRADGMPLQGDEYDFFLEFSIEKFIIDKQVSDEKAAALRRTLDKLSKRQQEVIYLKFYQHLDHAQIAELMNISRQSVYNLLHESILKLRNLWQLEFVGQ
jgi:RNA polymerase sigma factor (sigma-70 family)